MIPGKAGKQEGHRQETCAWGAGIPGSLLSSSLLILPLAFRSWEPPSCPSPSQVLGATVLPVLSLPPLLPFLQPQPSTSVLVLHTDSLPCILPCLCATCSDCPFRT